MYCKVRESCAKYGGWIGVANGVVGETSAQGKSWSVSITPDPDTPLTEVYLAESMLMFFSKGV